MHDLSSAQLSPVGHPALGRWELPMLFRVDEGLGLRGFRALSSGLQDVKGVQGSGFRAFHPKP